MINFKKLLIISIISFILGFLYIISFFIFPLNKFLPNSIFSLALPYILILFYIILSEKNVKLNFRSFFMFLIYIIISIIAYIIGIIAILGSFSFNMM